MKTENYLDPERLAELQQRIWDVATHRHLSLHVPNWKNCSTIGIADKED